MRPEDIAYWYFRLNGFFTITNFILHPGRRGPQRTDADIVGVRFPHRAEFSDSAGGDESVFADCEKLYFLIAEVKRQQCALNGPWTRKKDENIHAILRDLGPISPDRISEVADQLYKKGFYSSRSLYCSLFCVGSPQNPELRERYPDVPQRTWNQILSFIHRRFDNYEARKADHEQWDMTGQDLWRCFRRYRKQDSFVRSVQNACGLQGLSTDPDRGVPHNSGGS